MDGALALSLFLQAVSTAKASLAFRDELVRVRTELEAATANLNSLCVGFDDRLRRLEEKSLAHSKKLSLLSWTSVFIRVALPILLTLSLIIVYLFIRPHIQNQGWTDIAAVVLSVILTIVSIIYTIIYAKRPKETSALNEDLYFDKSETPLLLDRQPINEIPRAAARQTTGARRND
jgi:hypothetical protein